MKNLILLLSVLFLSVTTYAQTNVSGSITNYTSWTKANSPYTVTGNLTIELQGYLQIEPGVVVLVDSNVLIEVKGQISAEGYISDSVIFKSSKVGNMWQGIRVLATSAKLYQLGSQLFFKYVVASDADTLISHWLDTTEHTYGLSSNFCRYYNNNFVSIGNAGHGISQSVIHDNEYGVDHTGVFSCMLYNNKHFGCNNCGAKSSVFRDHPDVAVSFSRVVKNCEFYDNNIAILSNWKPQVGTYEIFSCDIHDNKTGIKIIDSQSTAGNYKIIYNKICNNTNFNIQASGKYNIDLSKDCFCSKDSTYIATTIYDYYDDTTVGILSYNTLGDCIFTSGGLNVVNATETQEEVKVYPIPFANSFTVEFAYREQGNYSFVMTDVSGRKVYADNSITSGKLVVNSAGVEPGMYIYHLYSNGKRVSSGKILRK